ncbi:MAG: hypothetical protein ACOC0S_03475 [Desulfohalobiaceae bacterium]
MNTKILYKTLILGLLGLGLTILCSGCSKVGVSWQQLSKPKMEAEQEQPQLEAGMDHFQTREYAQAKELFLQTAQNADVSSQIQQQAELGAILSDMLLAETPKEIQDLEQELTALAKDASRANAMNARMLRPFVKIVQEKQTQTQELQSLKSQNQAAQNKIQALEQENKNLADKLQELETLFNRMEHQKRRLFQDPK